MYTHQWQSVTAVALKIVSVRNKSTALRLLTGACSFARARPLSVSKTFPQETTKLHTTTTTNLPCFLLVFSLRVVFCIFTVCDCSQCSGWRSVGWWVLECTLSAPGLSDSLLRAQARASQPGSTGVCCDLDASRVAYPGRSCCQCFWRR